jgi:hypothetical protein
MRPGSRPPDSPRAFPPRPPVAGRRRRGRGRCLGLGIYLILPLPGVTVSAGGADRRQLHQRQLGHRGVHSRRRHAAPGQPGPQAPGRLRGTAAVPRARATASCITPAATLAGNPATSPRSPGPPPSPDPRWARPGIGAGTERALVDLKLCGAGGRCPLAGVPDSHPARPALSTPPAASPPVNRRHGSTVPPPVGACLPGGCNGRGTHCVYQVEGLFPAQSPAQPAGAGTLRWARSCPQGRRG